MTLPHHGTGGPLAHGTPATSATGLAHGVHLQARRTPHAPALVDGRHRFDYAALDAAGAAVAAALDHEGVRPGDAVAVVLPRSWQLLVVVLGALRRGARVVPLDAQSPPERQAHILTDSGSVVLVHGTTPPKGLPDGPRPLPAARLLAGLPGLPEVPDVLDVPGRAGPATGDAGGAGRAAATADATHPFPERPAGMTLYTSGTTGRPKGVEVPEAGVLRLARPGWLRTEPGQRYSCLSNPAFDAINFELWVPLLTGGCCVVLRDEDVQTPHRLAAALLRERVDTVFVTTALFHAVVDTVPSCFAGTREVLIGGEQLNASAVRRWYAHNAGAATVLHNVYGPTEVCTFALIHPIPEDFEGDVVPVGRPLPETGVLLVAPGTEQPAAPGEVAELLLSGTGVATGYRNLPEETARRFVRLPRQEGGRERFYRTGDLVRAEPDGALTCRGRADRQVKVRGFRIEPAEVERRIAAHPDVRQVHVSTRPHPETAALELLAHLVAEPGLGYEEFDRHLASALPAYMRPHHVYRVDALPHTGNGKVDGRALLRRTDPPWQNPVGAAPAAEVTARQREVLELAERVLGTSGLRPADRWIPSGGDSLRALRLRFEIRRRFGRELTQATVLRSDFAALAEAIDGTPEATRPRHPVPDPPGGARRGPATSEQQRLWLHQRRFPDSRAYTVGQAFRLDGPVDAAALRRALRDLVALHPALRTGFEESPEGLTQFVGVPYDPWTAPADLTAHTPAPDGVQPPPAEAESVLIDTFFGLPHDLSRPRMLDACWLPRPEGGTLLLRLHHIAVDGWSMTLLLRDLSQAYTRALDAPDTPLPDASPAPTPLDHAHWQQRWFAHDTYRTLREESRNRGDAEEEPAEPLPSAGPEGTRGRLTHTVLGADRRAAVDRLCAELELSRFELLLGVFACGLYAVTGTTRPRIAAPVTGRAVPEFESSVGMFANTVLLPVTLAPRGALRAEVLRLGAAVRETLDRQDVSLADVLDDRGHPAGESPFDILFVLENTEFDALRLPGVTARPAWRAPAEAKVPLTFSVVERPDGFDCLWEYAAGHFTEAEIEAMDRMFRTGLDLLADRRPGTPAELAAPYRRALPALGRGGAPAPGWTTVAEGFAAQAARTPDAPALRTGDGDITYARLARWAAALAEELRAATQEFEGTSEGTDGTETEQRHVALFLEPSVEHVVALLALARLNWTAVPLDPAYPAEPLRQILRQITPVCVLLAPGGGPAFDAVDPGGTVRRTVTLTETEPTPPPPHAGRPLYTLFTSGSTGVPKGVQVHDRTLTNLLHWQAAEGGLTGPAVTQQFSMLSFDVSFQEIFTTLCGGGCLNLVRPEWRHDVPALLDRMEAAGVERVFMPYVALQLLAEHAVHLGRYPSRLREVVTAGEQLVCTDAIRRWFAGLPGARLFNHYGPTETHVVSALCLEGDPALWPERPAIGTPVAGARLRVVDPGDQPLPPGRVGDLLIGGLMASRCYLGDAALNEERFVELPGEGLFYRSGDRASFTPDGLLHYHGRQDQQIKLSGHRLELGQVEAALLRHPDVVNAAVGLEDGALTACLECRAGAPTSRALTEHLAPLLPPHVRIGRFRVLASLPRTPSGKVDRRAALRAPGRELPAASAGTEGASGRERDLSAAFEEATGLPIGPDRTFFEAGASSLGLMRFHLRCGTALGLRFEITDLFEHVTIRALARFLDRREADHGTDHAPGRGTDAGAADAGTDAPRAPASGTVPSPSGERPGTPPAPPGHLEPIAVVGMAVRLPGAPDLASFWDLIRRGGTGIEYFETEGELVGARSAMDGLLDFDPDHFGISPQEARLMDPQQRHMLMTCVEALAHAGVADTSALRVGIVAAAGENTYFQDMLRESDPGRLPDDFQLALHHEKDFLATKAAYHLDLTGPAFTVQAACASSLFALHTAAGLLRQGDADVMLAGGVLVDTRLSRGYRYRPQHIFSEDGHCRAFSDDATGTVGASGIAMLVLKPLRLAREAGDTVYATVTGSAVNNDGADKLGYSAPALAGQREVIRTALRRSGRTGADVGYVEAHGTGTRLGDPVEVGALRQAYDVAESGRTAISSLKSQIGHLGAAAGAAGLVRAALCVHHGIVPPTRDFRAPNPRLGPDPTPFHFPTEARAWPAGRPRVAAVSSFGIGGANAHVVIEAGEEGRPAGEVVPCLPLSASGPAALRADAERVADYLQAHPESYPAVLQHLQSGRPARRWRMAAVCPDPASAVRWLRGAEGTEVEPSGETVAAQGLDARHLAEAFLAGHRLDRPKAPAQAPWDFPPPAFARAAYDFPRTATAATTVKAAEATGAAPGPERLPEERWLHQPHWVRLRRAGTATTADPAPRPLVLVTDDPAGPARARELRALRPRVVLVTAGETFARLDEDSYRVDPADPEALGQLLDVLDGLGTVDWLHALPLGVPDGPVDEERLRRARRACLDAPAALVRAAAGRTGIVPRPVWLSYRARPVDGPVDRPELALLTGVTEVAPQEGAAPGLWVDLPAADLAAVPPLASLLASLLASGEELPTHLALRRGYWWRRDTAPVTAPATAADTGVPAGPDTVHLVLGGTGGIGATLAGWLLERTAGRVLLLSRHPALPEPLTARADRIDLVTADLTAATPDALAALVAGRTGRLDTVVHAAGEGTGGLLARRDPATAHAGSLAKLNGALLVERLIERFRPRTALYCSSMAGTLGGVGQYDYAAAAGVLDAFAHHEPERPPHAGDTLRLSLAWDVWREVGMALRVPSADARHRAHLAVGLTVPEGRRTLERALSAGLPHVLVSTTEPQASRAFYAGPAPAPAATAPATPAATVPADAATSASAAVPGEGEAAALVGGWLREWLGLDTLAPDTPLYDLGADSLTLLELIDRIKRHFDVELDLAELSPDVTLTEVLTLLDRSRTPAPPATGALSAGPAPDVPLEVWREGTGEEVLCLVHPVGGDIQAYRALVAGLDPRLTVALIADPALRRPEARPEWTLTERARHYHAALEARFPATRWRRQLAGWSFGAWVAVGMAAEAEAAGRPADVLHLLDPPPPGSGPLHQAYGEEELQALFAHELGLGERRAGEAAREYAERLTRRCLANLRSMAAHDLPPLATTPARVWLARHPVPGLPRLGPPAEQRRLWDTVLTAPSHWEEVETTHYGLVRPPHVTAVTDAVNATVR
ncbi:amino acid adenylation domain-containing protein [Streptomyces griseoaurantiacus]|uniref:amino acid adenylation domain-containing protein n=1 Tax=Streptomyces griseoaurantiacus TaxID=68213 RepID=UPI00378976A2